MYYLFIYLAGMETYLINDKDRQRFDPAFQVVYHYLESTRK